ncbi:MAG: response regulator [Lachnospiraceae bacterium]|nr:response regulator [Lachnospiraceae bacterium]
MYRVAVLDDEKVYLKVFENLVGEMLDKEEISYTIDVFDNIKELEGNLKNQYDLFILDIMVSGMNGITFERKLKSIRSNANLIFVAENEEQLKKGKITGESLYLLKPVKNQEVEEMVRQCVVDYFAKKSITIMMDEDEFEIHPKDIYYIEHIYNGIRVYGEIHPICTLDSTHDLFPIIEGDEFLRCHKDYIVNLRYVEEIEKYDFKLINGQVVPITKNMYKTAQKELMEYIK